MLHARDLNRNMEAPGFFILFSNRKTSVTVTTHNDDGFTERVNRIANRFVYGIPQSSEENPYEIIAAKLLLRWEIEERLDEE